MRVSFFITQRNIVEKKERETENNMFANFLRFKSSSSTLLLLNKLLQIRACFIQCIPPLAAYPLLICIRPQLMYKALLTHSVIPFSISSVLQDQLWTFLNKVFKLWSTSCVPVNDLFTLNSSQKFLYFPFLYFSGIFHPISYHFNIQHLIIILLFLCILISITPSIYQANGICMECKNHGDKMHQTYARKHI